MLNNPMDILTQFPVRRNKKQKKDFRDAVREYTSGFGFDVTVEKGSYGCKNVVIGDPENAKYLVTAHYDTPARMPFPNLITPCNLWGYIGYQIFVVLVLLLPPVLPGLLVGYLTNNFQVGYFTWYLCFLAFFLLTIFGPANPNNANDNTSGVVALLKILETLPAEYRENVCFVLFDLEEMGLVGSKFYQSVHKTSTEKQLVLNLDCVGDGDIMLAFPTKKLRKDPEKMEQLQKLINTQGSKRIGVHAGGFHIYPSDQRSFPYAVGIGAFHRGKCLGLYCNRIHTKRDTTLDEENVNILRDRLLAVITG